MLAVRSYQGQAHATWLILKHADDAPSADATSRTSLVFAPDQSAMSSRTASSLVVLLVASGSALRLSGLSCARSRIVIGCAAEGAPLGDEQQTIADLQEQLKQMKRALELQELAAADAVRHARASAIQEASE
eukprot:3816306-Prymnesium_polylepis.1